MNHDIHDQVRQDYTQILLDPKNSIITGNTGSHTMSSSVGYTPEELALVPAESNLGLGCGNPHRAANLQPGEYVIDLGSGAGLDCFLAGMKVGRRGKAVGVDMTPDMLSTARRIAKENKIRNVEFRLGEIENLPAADNFFDVCISNCVINMSPSKARVYREIFRVLKPGGRISICDIVIMKQIPEELQNDPSMHSCWVSGASSVEELERIIKMVGFTDVSVKEKPVSKEYEEKWGSGLSVGEFIMSSTITARKPADGEQVNTTAERTSSCCCGSVWSMWRMDMMQQLIKSILTSIELSKCRHCGCMRESLEGIRERLEDSNDPKFYPLFCEANSAAERLETVEYTWLGCKQCWSADITNAFNELYGDCMETCSLAEVLGGTGDVLPALGEYHILALDEQHPVAVSTLGDCELPDILAAKKPKGMCVVGKTETENIGVEKIIQNTLAVPTIRYLLLCGEDSQGHFSGQTILSLFENGVNERMRVVGARGKRPILANTTPQAVAAFTNQVEIVDMIGCTDANEIIRKIEALAVQEPRQRQIPAETPADIINTPEVKVITAKPKDPQKVKLDLAGYFVIVPKAELGIILVEHYNYANQLLRVIQGDNARDIYWTIIENNWVGEMSHAAYLGKELTAAQLSMQMGFKYIQDKA